MSERRKNKFLPLIFEGPVSARPCVAVASGQRVSLLCVHASEQARRGYTALARPRLACQDGAPRFAARTAPRCAGQPQPLPGWGWGRDVICARISWKS